jgi:hypothetical protein
MVLVTDGLMLVKADFFFFAAAGSVLLVFSFVSVSIGVAHACGQMTLTKRFLLFLCVCGGGVFLLFCMGVKLGLSH